MQWDSESHGVSCHCTYYWAHQGAAERTRKFSIEGTIIMGYCRSLLRFKGIESSITSFTTIFTSEPRLCGEIRQCFCALEDCQTRHQRVWRSSNNMVKNPAWREATLRSLAITTHRVDLFNHVLARFILQTLKHFR